MGGKTKNEMNIIKSLTESCRDFIERNVPSDMKMDGSIIVEFSRINEVLAALQNSGFKRERDFVVLP